MSKILHLVLDECNYMCPYHKEDKSYTARVVDYPTCSMSGERELPHTVTINEFSGVPAATPTHEFPSWCSLTQLDDE